MVIGVCRLLTVRSGPVDDAQLFRSAWKRNKFWKSCGNYQKRCWKPLLSSCGSWTNSVCACQTCLPCKMAGLVRPGQEKTRRRRCPTLPNLPSRGAHRWKWARFCWEKGERHTAMSCILQAFACLEASQPKGSPWEIWSRYSCPYVYQPGADAQTNSSGFGTRQGPQAVGAGCYWCRPRRAIRCRCCGVAFALPIFLRAQLNTDGSWFGHRHPRLDGATWKAAGPCKGQKQTLASHGRVPAQTAFQKIRRLGVFLSCLQVCNWAAFNQLTIAFVWLFACLMVLRRWV